MNLSRTINHSLVVVALIALFTSASAQQTTQQVFEIAGSGNYWDNSSIPVCFLTDARPLNELRPIRARIRHAAEASWELVSKIDFTGFGICESGAKGIQVKHKGGSVSSSGLGPSSNGRREIRMAVTASDRVIVHEFGHALGFGHGQAREDTPSYCVSGLGGGSVAGVSDRVTDWDPLSVMNYCQISATQEGHLSPLDIQGVIKIYGSDRRNTLGKNEQGDGFGTSMATGDFNGDGHADLAVGTPQEDLSGIAETGVVYIYHGNSLGALIPSHSVRQTPLGRTEAGDHFGALLVAADLDGRPGDELVVSAPREKPGSQTMRSGALFVYRSNNGKLAPWKVITQSLNQAYPGVAQTGARPGLARSLASGDLNSNGRFEIYAATSEADSRTDDRPAVVGAWEWSPQTDKFTLVGATARTQRSGGFGASLVIGDFIQDSSKELAVGVPLGASSTGEPTISGGRVDLYQLRSGTLQLTSTLKQRAGASPERGDMFGRSLAVGDFNGDDRDDLAVGAPGEVIGNSGFSEGNVTVFTGHSSTTMGVMQQISQLNFGEPHSKDRTGQSLASGDFDGNGIDDLVIGVPGETNGERLDQSGLAFVGYGGASGMSRYHWISQKPVGKDEFGDRFASNFAVADLDLNGTMELIVAAPGESPGSDPKSGQVFVLQTPYSPLQAYYSFDQEF